MSLFQELKRRNVFRVAAAYLVAAWLLIEVSATLEETLHLPEWADSLLAMFLLLGFPLALFFSWVYEITPDGLKREKELEDDPAYRAVTARKLDWLVVFMVCLAIVFFVLDRFVLPPAETAPNVVEIVEQAGTTTVLDEIDDEKLSEPETGVAEIPHLSIAVLPFVNMSSDPEQEYFSDGLTEELLNLLARISQLKVAARTSSFYYKDKLNDIKFDEVAGELGVAHILEGSVRKGRDTIRITAQLIQADNGFHLWSETYDRKLDDVFAIQDEIAAAVVHELKITLLGEVPHAKVLDTESWELTLQARHLFSRRAEGDLDRALQLYERAVELDPDNAAAWVGMSPLYIWLFDPPQLEKSLAAAENAVRLDPQNPEARARLAMALFSLGRDEAASKQWNEAQELGKDNALIQSMVAGSKGNRGDLEGAIAHQQRAVMLEPLYIVNLGNLASYLEMADRFEEAEKYALKAMELAPNSPVGFDTITRIRLLEGQTEAALDWHLRKPKGQKIVENDDSLRIITLVNHAMGNTAESNAALDRMIEMSPEDAYTMTLIGSVYAWQGKKDQAFAWLNKALDTNPELSRQFSWDPFLNPLESDPRWQELMNRWTGPREP